MNLKITLLLLVFFYTIQSACSQVKEPEIVSFGGANDPEFPGGEDAMINFLRKNINFPRSVRRDSTFTEETVYVNFVVNKKGEITMIKELKKQLVGRAQKEAIRVVKSMPNWKAGIQNGKAVKVNFTLPIQFVSEE